MQIVYCKVPCISPGLIGILVNDWAALYSKGAYTRGGLYTEHLAKFAMLPTTNFMFRKNCTDFEQTHYKGISKRLCNHHYTIF